METQTSTLPSQPYELIIQTALPTDAQAIASIGAKTFAQSFGHSMLVEHMQTYLNEAYTLSAITNDLAYERNQFFVARLKSALAADNEGEVVGFIQLKLGSTEPCLPTHVPLCEIQRIYVDGGYHGGGAGRLLMEKGLEWARERLLGVGGRKAAVWLGVWEENARAMRFYRRWEFERVGEHEFVMGGTRQKDFVMMKWLGGDSGSGGLGGC
ncbi:MAG: hypothetical protein Q9161_009380 [Pseudevernia consocians]